MRMDKVCKVEGQARVAPWTLSLQVGPLPHPGGGKHASLSVLWLHAEIPCNFVLTNC